jgi:hypothetical protein
VKLKLSSSRFFILFWGTVILSLKYCISSCVISKVIEELSSTVRKCTPFGSRFQVSLCFFTSCGFLIVGHESWRAYHSAHLSCNLCICSSGSYHIVWMSFALYWCHVTSLTLTFIKIEISRFYTINVIWSLWFWFRRFPCSLLLN